MPGRPCNPSCPRNRVRTMKELVKHHEEFFLNCQGTLCWSQTSSILWPTLPFLHAADENCTVNQGSHEDMTDLSCYCYQPQSFRDRDADEVTTWTELTSQPIWAYGSREEENNPAQLLMLLEAEWLRKTWHPTVFTVMGAKRRPPRSLAFLYLYLIPILRNHTLERDVLLYYLEKDADNQLRLNAQFLDICYELRWMTWMTPFVPILRWLACKEPDISAKNFQS